METAPRDSEAMMDALTRLLAIVGKMSSAVELIEPLVLQVAASECAVRALIATHPNPSAARAIFDQLFAQIQASTAGDGAGAAEAKRQAAKKLFEPPQVL